MPASASPGINHSELPTSMLSGSFGWEVGIVAQAESSERRAGMGEDVRASPGWPLTGNACEDPMSCLSHGKTSRARRRMGPLP